MPRNPTISFSLRFSVGVSKRTQILPACWGRTGQTRQDARALSRGSPVEEHQQQDEYTKGEAVDNKDLQRACLQITQEKGDHRVAHHRRHQRC